MSVPPNAEITHLAHDRFHDVSAIGPDARNGDVWVVANRQAAVDFEGPIGRPVGGLPRWRLALVAR